VQRHLTGQAGFTGLSGFLLFFPFPEEKQKDNPPPAERASGVISA